MPARMVLLSAGLTLGVPAYAADEMAGLPDCMDASALDGMAERYERLAAERGIEAQVEALCAAGDLDATAATWTAFEDELYAPPGGAQLRACLAAQLALMHGHLRTLGLDMPEEPHVCDPDV